MRKYQRAFSGLIGVVLLGGAGPAFAAGDSFACAGLPDFTSLRSALKQAVDAEHSGLDNNMWATLVARDGTVCAVAFSGNAFTDQWLGSRVISAQKANTGVDFSLSNPSVSAVFPHGLALSTANLYSAVQPGGSLYGLQHSNPVDTQVAYDGDASTFGTKNDPMVGHRIGGVNVFGGGFALYRKGGINVGGLGVSGDTSCADHMIGWRVRHTLGLDFLGGVGGVADDAHPDNIIYDIAPNPNGGTGISKGGFGHPTCINTGDQTALPAVQK